MPAPIYDDLGANVPFHQQLQLADTGPVIMVNTFTVKPEQADAMLQTWVRDSAVMKQQPGFISAQLHKGVGGSGVFINYAVWESAAHLRAAVANPEFKAAIERTPEGAIARPHIVQKIAVPGVCVDR